jgi:hypothetical protein
VPLFTPIGLAAPAGLNAYIPLLAIAIAQRAGLLQLAKPYDVLGSWWAIGVLSVLLVVEVFADKIPAVDHVNDVIQTVVRPAAGGIAFVAASGQFGQVHPVLTLLAGIVLAGSVHALKATVRPAVNVTTAGFGAPIVSAVEDIVAAVTSILAILAPMFVGVMFLVAGYAFWRVAKGARARRRVGSAV